jgi:hypothetical protein
MMEECDYPGMLMAVPDCEAMIQSCVDILTDSDRYEWEASIGRALEAGTCAEFANRYATSGPCRLGDALTPVRP